MTGKIGAVIFEVSTFSGFANIELASFASLLISRMNGFAFGVVQVSLNVSHINI